MAYVTAEVVDEHNQVVPTAEVRVQFTVNGAGELATVGNANPADVSSFQRERKTFQGRCLAIVRPRGKPGGITVKAAESGVNPAQITIVVR